MQRFTPMAARPAVPAEFVRREAARKKHHEIEPAPEDEAFTRF